MIKTSKFDTDLHCESVHVHVRLHVPVLVASIECPPSGFCNEKWLFGYQQINISQSSQIQNFKFVYAPSKAEKQQISLTLSCALSKAVVNESCKVR